LINGTHIVNQHLSEAHALVGEASLVPAGRYS
jgi:hypothetical protein